MKQLTRRRFLAASAVGATGALFTFRRSQTLAAQDYDRPSTNIQFGLVTYLWGRDWDLPTLLTNCEQTKVLGVELRTTHAHGVEPSLSQAQRAEVKKRFEDSPVTHVGLGSNERFDEPDAARFKKAIEASKAFIVLSHDTGGSGVKVKPNDFHKNVPRQQTIEQIGKALNQLGQFGAGYGQEIRLEVHGGCAHLPDIKAIMDVANHENVGVCWNCNKQDLAGDGLAHNFSLVKNRLGQTCHVRELDGSDYPYQQLFNLLVENDYRGWVLLEARGNPRDRIQALKEQRRLYDRLLAQA